MATDGIPIQAQPQATPVESSRGKRIWRSPISIVLIIIVLVIMADSRDWQNSTSHISAVALLVALLVAKMISAMGFPRGFRPAGNASLLQGNVVPTLNPPKATPVANVIYPDGRRVTTAEMVTPPSVTERTTKLMDNQPPE